MPIKPPCRHWGLGGGFITGFTSPPCTSTGQDSPACVLLKPELNLNLACAAQPHWEMVGVTARERGVLGALWHLAGCLWPPSPHSCQEDPSPGHGQQMFLSEPFWECQVRCHSGFTQSCSKVPPGWKLPSWAWAHLWNQVLREGNKK